MFQFAIRCHPSVPVAAEELEHWLEQQVADLRAMAPEGTIRLSRLTQGLPSGDIDTGWLLELELSDSERHLIDDRLTEAVRDMQLLGFDPTVLAPLEAPGQANGQGRPAAVAALPDPGATRGSAWTLPTSSLPADTALHEQWPSCSRLSSLGRVTSRIQLLADRHRTRMTPARPRRQQQ